MADNKTFLAMRVDPKLLAAVDAIVPHRGRTRWIEAAMREKLAAAPAKAAAQERHDLAIQTGNTSGTLTVSGVEPSFTASSSANVTISYTGVAGQEDGSAGHTMNPSQCAHIVLGAPERDEEGKTYRICRGCGESRYDD